MHPAAFANLLLVVAGFFAGMINSVAGGGSFLTFPALVFAGVPLVASNATSTVALLPGTFASIFSYRGRTADIPGLNYWALLTVCIAGGLLGSVLLLKTPESAFVSIAPWLLLFATIVFAFGKQISGFLRARFHIGAVVLFCIQGLIAIYGGYFGGGIGIMMLAGLSLYGMTDINAMNGLKTTMGGAMNLVAAMIFIFSGLVHWQEAAVMAIASTAGGYLGATYAQKLDPRYIRATVIIVGALMTIYFFVRA